MQPDRKPSQWARERERTCRDLERGAMNRNDIGAAMFWNARAIEADVFAAHLEDMERKR